MLLSCSSSRTLLINVLLAVSAIVCTLLCVEVTLRAIDHFTHFMDTYDLKQITGNYSVHSQLNHTISPNINKFVQPHHEINIPGYKLKTNSLGFRFDMERFKLEKEPGTFRIAVLGDSQIEGFFDEEFTLSSLLEKDLSDATRSSKRIETMNFGVSSHSTIISYVKIKKYVLGYKPDLVILHFDLTDVYDDNIRYKDLTVWDQYGNPDYVKPSLYYLNLNLNINGKTVSIIDYGSQRASLRPLYSIERLRIWSLDHSFLFKYIYARRHSGQQMLNLYLKELESEFPGISSLRREDDDMLTALEWCESHESVEMQKQVEFSLKILEKVCTLLKRNNVPVVIITIPNVRHLSAGALPALWLNHPIEDVAKFCNERGIPFHCPVSEFNNETKKGNMIYYSDGMHNNPNGMKVWSKALSKYLLNSSLIVSR